MSRIPLIGCLACRQEGLFTQAEVDHLIDGGVRLGHRFTIGLCSWHHRAAAPRRPGPARAQGSKPFHATYGSDAELLAVQDQLVGWTEPEAPRRRSSLSSPKCLPRP
jgi:hypothetical protein